MPSWGSSIMGFVYLGAEPSFDRQRFVLALPKVKAHRTALKAHGVHPYMTIAASSFIHQ